MNHAVSVPFRAGLRLQGHHAFGRAGNHPASRPRASSTATAACSAARPRDSRFSRRAGPHSHGDGPGEIQQHRRNRDRHEGGAGQHVQLRAALRIRPEDRNRPAGRIARQVPQSCPRWGKTSLASISMGQEVSVTTVQLAQAAAVIANGGLLVKPRLVLKRGDQPSAAGAAGARCEAGDRHHHAPDDGGRGPARHREPAPSWPGTRWAARPARRRSSIVATHHYTHTYNGSFMGFAPVTNPAIVAVVTLERHPRRRRDSAVWWRRRSSMRWWPEALRVLDVPKDLPDEPPARPWWPRRRTLDDLADADVDSGEPNILEDSDDDAPASATPANPAGPKVPNFRGYDDARGAGGGSRQGFDCGAGRQRRCTDADAARRAPSCVKENASAYSLRDETRRVTLGRPAAPAPYAGAWPLLPVAGLEYRFAARPARVTCFSPFPAAARTAASSPRTRWPAEQSR